MRITIQSFPFRPHAPAGTVTVANPSSEVTDVDALELVFPSTGGTVTSELCAELCDQTVKLTRKGDHLPDESVSPPASVCSPSESGPVL